MSLSLNNSTIVPLLSGEVFLGKEYDNILDFAEINIAIRCDVGYTLTYIYSQDKLTIDYEESEVIPADPTTLFFKFGVKNRYFKLKIEATDGDMSVLNVQTIYKAVTTFNKSGSGPTSNVTIVNPLNLNGSVAIGGEISGSVDANITNSLLDVTVNNFPASQDVNITNSSIDTNIINFPASQDVNVLNQSIDTNITNTSLDVNVTNSSFAVTNAKLDLLQFDAFNNLNTNLNNINSNFVDPTNNNGLKVAIQNSLIAVSNGALSSMSFNLGRLTVLDSDANSKLENIYNLQNTKSSTTLWASAILAGGFTNVLNLNQKKITNITFLGNQDSNGNVLTVQFSNNNITWYDSQYSYSFGSSVAGDFGFNIQCCPQYLRVKSANACYLILEVSFC